MEGGTHDGGRAECAGPAGGGGVIEISTDLRWESSTLAGGRADSKRYAHSAGPGSETQMVLSEKGNKVSLQSYPECLEF